MNFCLIKKNKNQNRCLSPNKSTGEWLKWINVQAFHLSFTARWWIYAPLNIMTHHVFCVKLFGVLGVVIASRGTLSVFPLTVASGLPSPVTPPWWFFVISTSLSLTVVNPESLLSVSCITKPRLWEDMSCCPLLAVRQGKCNNQSVERSLGIMFCGKTTALREENSRPWRQMSRAHHFCSSAQKGSKASEL